jgi:hypothetical protein
MLNKEDQRLIVRKMAAQFSIWHYVVKVTGYWKVCSCWFPACLLAYEWTEKNMHEYSSQLLQQHSAEHDFVFSILTSE